MIGVEGAKEITKTFLELNLPARCADPTRPTDPPKFYGTAELPRINPDQWPAVNVVGVGTAFTRRVGVDGHGAPVYEIGYRLRVFDWVRGQGFDDTTQRRDRLTTAIVESLLAGPALVEGGWARLEGDTLRQNLSDVLPAEEGASVAAASIEFVVTVVETIPLDPVASAGETEAVTVLETPLA